MLPGWCSPKRLVLLLLAVGVTMAVTACGSSDSDSTATTAPASTDSSGSASAEAPTGSPVVIGGFGAASGPGSNPELPAAIEAAVEYVNDHGGAGGRPLVYKFCDDQNSQTVATNCATKLIKQDKVVALVGLGSYFNPVAAPLIEGTDVPIFGMIGMPPGLEDMTNVYTVHPLASGYAAAAKALAEDTQAKKAAIVALSGAEVYSDIIEIGFSNGGATDIDVITYPEGTTNFASIVQQVSESGAEVLASVQAAEEATAFLTAAQQAGLELPYASCDCGLNTAAVEALSSMPIENVVALAFNEDSPAWGTYLESLEEYVPGKVTSPFYSPTSDAWVSTYLFATQVADQLSDVTSASVSEFLREQQAFDTEGLTAPIDFTKLGTWSQYPTMRNLSGYIGEAKDGELTQLSQEPVSGFEPTPSGNEPREGVDS